MKKCNILYLLCSVSILSAPIYISAEEQSDSSIVKFMETDSSGKVKVIQPSKLGERISKTSQADAIVEEKGKSEHKSLDEISSSKGSKRSAVGFRIQVVADNNVRTAKNEASRKQRAISARFPNLDTYLSYTSPFWRLRVGNFKSREAAAAALRELKQAFPSYAAEMRIVREKISIRHDE